MMILLYHCIVPNDSPPERWYAGQALPQFAFERQIRWLANHHRIVSLAEYVAGMQQPEFNKRRLIAITFDDGFGITFQCVFPFLVEMNIPATIFTTTGHLEHGELLWFSYLKALCFENLYQVIQVSQLNFSLQTIEQRKQAYDELRLMAKTSGNPSNYCKILSETYPLNPEMVVLYGGMAYEQLRVAGKNDILEFGSHTITHPYLNQLSEEDQGKEILESRHILSELTGKLIRYFAYPGGEYNHDTVRLVKTAGYEAAFAVIPQKRGLDSKFEIGRMGIYSRSLIKLQLKMMGVANLARQFGLKVG